MKRNAIKHVTSDQPTSQVDLDSTNEIFIDPDVAGFDTSRGHLVRNSQLWSDFHKDDWWIAIALYLLLAMVVFLAL
jgi:hypothetical protein